MAVRSSADFSPEIIIIMIKLTKIPFKVSEK